jgi:hypothetical protein
MLRSRDALWGSFTILVTLTAAACSGAQATQPPVSWDAYANRWFSYEVRYPPGSSLVETLGGASTVIYLNAGTEPFAASHDFVILTAAHTADECEPPTAAAHGHQSGRRFRIGPSGHTSREGQAEGSTGTTRWESYSTGYRDVCVTDRSRRQTS